MLSSCIEAHKFVLEVLIILVIVLNLGFLLISRHGAHVVDAQVLIWLRYLRPLIVDLLDVRHIPEPLIVFHVLFSLKLARGVVAWHRDGLV